MIRIVLLLSFLCCSIAVFSQALEKNNYTKVEIRKGNTRVVNIDSVRIDTLVMLSKSTLRFDQGTTIIVENAFIGEDCVHGAYGVKGRTGVEGRLDFLKLDE